MNITIKQLGVFAAIARHSSVSLAAEELCLSQPATSMALAELERILGDKFFDRKGRKLQLNEKGRALMPMAIDCLNRVKEISDKFSSGSHSLIGQVNIGCSTTIGNYVIPSLLGPFEQKSPDIDFDLVVKNSQTIIDEILKFNLDMGVIEGICQEADIEVIPWRRDRLVVFTHPKHPLANKEKVTVNDLEDAEWILREGGSGSYEIFENAVKGKLKKVNIKFKLGHTEAIKNTVASGNGISCLSILAIESMLERGELVEIPTPFLKLDRHFSLLIHRKKYRNEIIKSCLDFFKEQSDRSL